MENKRQIGRKRKRCKDEVDADSREMLGALGCKSFVVNRGRRESPRNRFWVALSQEEKEE